MNRNRNQNTKLTCLRDTKIEWGKYRTKMSWKCREQHIIYSYHCCLKRNANKPPYKYNCTWWLCRTSTISANFDLQYLLQETSNTFSWKFRLIKDHMKIIFDGFNAKNVFVFEYSTIVHQVSIRRVSIQFNCTSVVNKYFTLSVSHG